MTPEEQESKALEFYTKINDQFEELKKQREDTRVNVKLLSKDLETLRLQIVDVQNTATDTKKEIGDCRNEIHQYNIQTLENIGTLAGSLKCGEHGEQIKSNKENISSLATKLWVFFGVFIGGGIVGMIIKSLWLWKG